MLKQYVKIATWTNFIAEGKGFIVHRAIIFVFLPKEHVDYWMYYNIIFVQYNGILIYVSPP